MGLFGVPLLKGQSESFLEALAGMPTLHPLPQNVLLERRSRSLPDADCLAPHSLDSRSNQLLLLMTAASTVLLKYRRRLYCREFLALLSLCRNRSYPRQLVQVGGWGGKERDKGDTEEGQERK